MKQEPQGQSWKVRDELQLGLDVYNRMKDAARAGGVPSEEDAAALGEFQTHLQLLAHMDRLGEGNPFLDLFQDLQHDAQLVTGQGARAASPLDPTSDDPLYGGMGLLQSAEPLVAPVHGLSRKMAFNPDKEAYESALDVRFVTDDERYKDMGYFVPKDILDREALFDDKLVRRAMQLSGGEVRTEMVGHQPTWTIDDGVETWDLTEQMGLWNRPDVKERLKLSLKGMPPVPGGEYLGAAPALTTMLELADKAVSMIGGDRPARRMMPTAVPGNVLPWEVPLGLDGKWRGDEDEVYRDPLYARALAETTRRMAESGELDPTTWEAFRGGLIGLADIAAFSVGLGAVGKGVGLAAKAAGASLGEGMASLGVRAYAESSGLAASRMYVFPLNTHFAQTVGLLAAHNVFGNMTNPATSLSEDVWRGAQAGAEIAAVGAAMKPLRVGLTAAMPWIGNVARRVAPRLALGLDPTGAMARTSDAADKMLRGLRTLPSADKKFTSAFRQLAVGGVLRESVLRSIDSFGVGMHLGARQWAEIQPGYDDLPVPTKIALYWRGLGSQIAWATGASFMLGGLALNVPAQRKAVHEFLKSENGNVLMAEYARRLGQPDREADVKASFEAMDAYREVEPDLFKGVVKMNPAAQKSWQAYEEGLQAVRSITGWHPLEGEPPSAAHTVVEPLAETPVQDALPRFRAMVEEAQGLVARSAPDVRQPVYTVGEVTPEFLETLGFGGRSQSGRYKHALNAVQEYLRVVDGVTETRYERLADVPRALFERALDWRDRQKKLPFDDALTSGEEYATTPPRREPRQLTLDEAARNLPATDGNGTYAGLTTGEKAAEVSRRKRERRPTLGRAMELVASGKRDAAWLRESFPEGAAAVADGPLETWAGPFERVVRAAWKAKAMANLRRGNVERELETGTLRSFVAKHGGIKHVGDLESFTKKELKSRRPIVQDKESGKGMPLDDMAELATEWGFFPEGRPTEREFIDAIFDDMPHPDRTGAGLERMAFAERDVMHAGQILDAREKIESGADLPTDPARRREILFDIFSSDPRFEGLTPERVEREVMGLRAERAAGAPPPEEAGPPETPVTIFSRAAARTRRLVETLQWGGLVPMDVAANDPSVAPIIVQVSSPSPEMAAVGEAKLGINGWAQTVAQAREVRALHRDAFLTRLELENRKPAVIQAIRDTYEAIDAALEGRDLSSDVRARLQKGGYLDEHGILKSRWEMALADEGSLVAFEAERMAREAGDLTVEFGSFVPPVALSGRTFTHVEETTMGKMLTLQHWMDQPGVQEFLSDHPYARDLVNWAKELTGPFTGPITTAEKDLMERAAVTLGLSKAAAGWAQLRMQGALSRLFHSWQGARPPQGDLKFWHRLIESGGLKNVRGPEDLERMRPGSGYMWPSMAEARDVLQEFGLDFVQAGWMTQGQLDTLGGGAYGKHLYVREQLEGDAAALGRGELPVRYFGSLLPRQGGRPSRVSMLVQDPLVYMRMSAHEQASLLRVTRVLSDFAGDGSFWKTEADMRRMNDYERSRYQVPAVRTTEADAAIERYQPGYNAEAARLGIILTNLRARMANQGEQPGEGQIAYSEKVDKLIAHWLGEGPNGRVFMPRALVKEIELAMSEVYVQRADPTKAGVFGRGLLHAMDQAGSWWKRGRTVLRYAHWTQQVLSNALNNHGTGRLPISDFVAGAAGLPSFTADGMKDFARMARWIKEGMPKERPASWTEDDWARAQRAKAFHDLAGGSSYALAGLSPEMAESFNLSLDNHNVVREIQEREARDQAAAEGWSKNELERVIGSVGELTGRLQSGLEPIDEMIGKLMASPDPVAHARSFGAATALYLYMDLALYKYPAYLKAKHEWPDASPAKLVAYSTAGAGDMRNTSPMLRRWLSMHSPAGSSLWRSTTAYPAAKTIMSQVFRNRFWMWSNATMPVLMRSAVRHPLLGASAAAIGGLGMSAILNSVLGRSDDEKRRFEEEMATARRGAFHHMKLSDVEREALDRMLRGSPLPDFTGGALRVKDPMVTAGLKTFWNAVSSGFSAQAPSRAGETRRFDLRDFAGPFGEAAKKAEGIASLAGLAKDLSAGDVNPQRMAELGDFAQRALGFTGALAANAIFGGPENLADALGGKTTFGEALVKSLQAFGRQMPVAYPVIGMMSAEGQVLGENVFAGGLRFNDALLGLERAYRSEGPAHLAADSAATLIWPSRSVMQMPALRSPTEGWSTLASAVLGEGVDSTTERGRRSMQAANFVAREMSIVLKDLYEQHFDEVTKPETAEIELDDRVLGALRETFDHTVEVQPDLWAIEPGYIPKGAILKAISGGSAEEIHYRTKYLRRWATQDSFKETGLNALLEAGRRVEMGKGLFGTAIQRAMSDPNGTQLLGWWWSRIKSGDKDAMGQLSTLVHDTPIPAPGSEAYGYWRDIMHAYWSAGLELPLELSDEHRRAIEAKTGTPLMLQGGKALRNELQKRPLLESLIPNKE